MRIILLIFLLLIATLGYSQNQDPNLSGNINEGVDQVESEILSYLEPYIYDVEGRRDPFQPFKIFIEEPSVEDQFKEETPIQKDVVEPRLPLLRYNLSQIELKAILWNVKNPKVIVQVPGNKLHMLRLKDRIGNNGGYIATIREGEVVVVQKVTVQGKEIFSTKYMRLKR